MPLRILHALHTIDPKASGLTEDVLLLSAVHRSLKHQVEILTVDAPGTSWLLELGVPVHRIGGSEPRRIAFQQFLAWLRNHANNNDCVLVSGISDFNAFYAWRTLGNIGVPYFVFAPRHLSFLSGLPRQIKQWKQRLCWPWAGYPLLRDAHAVFFSSEEARRQARQSFWPYDCHEFVLTCGVAKPPDGVAEAARSELLVEHPELLGKHIFSVFADGSGKIPECLLAAVRTLVNAGRWDRGTMRLLIAGGADTANASAWKYAVDLHGLRDIVILAATQSGRTRRGILQASEALIQPARMENSNLMVAEAFSVGTPVLITRGVNLWREVVLHSAGFAADDTVDGYKELFIHWLDQSSAEHAAMRTQARQGFETHFSEQAAANTLTAVAYLLIGANRAHIDSTNPEIFRSETDFL